MKRRDVLIALAAAGVAPAATVALAGAGPAAPGQPVRWPAALPLIDGSTWQARPGQAQIVVFWSTNCGFCKRHNVHVERLQRSLAGLPVQLLTATRDHDTTLLRRVAAERGYSFPVTQAAHALAAVLSERRMVPLTVTVDRSGRLRQVIPGEMSESDVLELAMLAN